jgi:2-polyprenyl-3-methyl-5-hydroxy-6-metoxy-1,4-benzoquinol methylase
MVQEQQVLAAVSNLLEAFRGNTWFSHYWDENWPRVRLILEDLHKYCPTEPGRVLDIGCGNGYISYLCSRLGYSVTATDAWDLRKEKPYSKHRASPTFQATSTRPALSANCQIRALTLSFSEKCLSTC